MLTTENYDDLDFQVENLTSTQESEFQAFLLTTNSGATIMKWLIRKLREWALPA